MKRRPINLLRTNPAKREADHYRSLGIKDVNMRFTRQEDGTECVLIDKDAVMHLAENSPLTANECISNLIDLGIPLDFEDELKIHANKRRKL